MAGDDGQERTEAPTQKRRDEARKEGRVPRSQEISGATLLLAGTGTLAAVGGAALATQAVHLLGTGAAHLTALPLSDSDVIRMLRELGRSALLAMLPFLLGVGAITLLVNAIQARGVITIDPVMPKFSHIDPVSGLKRLFSIESLFAVLKAVLKLLVIGWVAWLVFRGAWPRILSTSGAEVPTILGVTRALAIRLAFMVGLAFLVVAAIDYGFQIWQYEKSLKMTKQEITQEFRESEGDPALKGRIRQLQRQMAKKRMMGKVATADVVVTNPTHIAVALKYDPLVAPAPIVVAMGERLLAQRIKELAYQAGVPVIENKPLARALFAGAKVGSPVPPALYVAVAEVIAFVFGRKGKPLPVGRNR
ncbi:MAG TPA: flagellar biosynthesis protein FlhB [Gemmatimonadales bacterium]|nr:flagellar biosynthesis protein FlhB [Gemmatimonadales bacterium]